jgi:hypothetical protein
MPAPAPVIDSGAVLVFSHLFVWFWVQVLDLPAMRRFGGGILGLAGIWFCGFSDNIISKSSNRLVSGHFVRLIVRIAIVN